MPKVRLTQRFSETASCFLGRQKEEWFDQDTKGFYLEVRSSGGKTYRLRTSDQHGFDRVITIGDAKCVTLAQARKKAIELRASVQLGKWEDLPNRKPQDAKEITFEDFVTGYYLPSMQMRKRSVASELSFLKNHLLPTFGSKPLSEITRLDLSQFHTSIRQTGYASGTADRMIILMRCILNHAIKLEVLPRGANPAEKFDLFNEPNNRERFLTESEARKLLNELALSENPDLLNIVSLLLMTGCRRGEILGARWKDVDFERGIFTIPITKQGKPHTLPMTEAIKKFLQNLPSRGISEYIFPNLKTSKPYKSIFYSWDRARKKAEMPELRLHDLRHSFASFLINSGRTLYEVQRLLGHASSKTTQRYAHLSERSLGQAISVVSELIPELANQTHS